MSSKISGVASPAPVHKDHGLKTSITGRSSEPEIVLWRNVVLLTLRDIASDGMGTTQDRKTRLSNYAYHARQAIKRKYFTVVCDYADLNYDAVLRVVDEIEAMIERDGDGRAFLKRGPGQAFGAHNRAAREAEERAAAAGAVLDVPGS